MKKTVMALFLSMLFVQNVMAKNIIDIYGLESDSASSIVKKYAAQIGEIADALGAAVKNNEEPSGATIKKYQLKSKQLADRIRNEFGFLYVDFDTVFYPGNINAYTTIEVIEKNRQDRLYYVVNQTPIDEKNKPIKRDLITEMIDYQNIGFKLMVNNQLNATHTACPVYHCTLGFHHKKLKPYLKLFNTGAGEERQLILNTLHHDANTERRVAAAYLVGHFKKPEEIVAILSPYANDNSDRIRNAAMRVVGETMRRANISKIDVVPFLNLLNSPYDTDRNKSLYIILEAANSTTSQSIIIQQGRENLLGLLKLKQPNNHKLSYRILKKISGKNSGEYDIESWKKWLMA